MVSDNEERRNEFKKNLFLEQFLEELNNNLSISEKKLLDYGPIKYPIIFIVGPLRSGTTLLLQWLANLKIVAYPTNLMSRFYKAPIIGSKIQLLLTDERLNFRNELYDFNLNIDFKSYNGKTKGILAPNEFWYFWRKFLPLKDLDYLPTDELLKKTDIKTFKAEFKGITEVFQKPFALKALICNYNIDFLDNIFEKAIFIYTKRNPLTNIESVLDARKRQYGTIEKWYSFKIPEYSELIKLDPYRQAAGQVYYINKAVSSSLENLPKHKKITVIYEEFCENPKKYYIELLNKLESNGYSVDIPYNGPEKFNITRKSVTDKKIIDAYKFFYK